MVFLFYELSFFEEQIYFLNLQSIFVLIDHGETGRVREVPSHLSSVHELEGKENALSPDLIWLPVGYYFISSI